jgi:hypothetical protein
MAPRKPKNPIQDIINTTSAWLGGNRGTVNPQVARVSRDLGTVAQTIDTFTGGFGAAAGRDARNFQQGGSLPTNLAKTAAVNLAAGAVGAKAAQVAGTAAKTAVVKGAKNLNAPKGDLDSLRGLYHGTSQKLKPGTVIRPRSDLGVTETWSGAKSNPNVSYATPYAEFAEQTSVASRLKRMNDLGFSGGGITPRTDTVVPSRRGPVTKKIDPRAGGILETNPSAYNKAVRQTRARVYEVTPVNPSTVKVQKIDKIREYVSPEGFIVKGEVYRGSVYNQTFPRSPSRIGSAIKAKLPKRK